MAHSHENTARILVVDDMEENIQLLRNLLVPKGYDVSFALSGEEALRCVVESRPDAILLDLVMPDMNGIQVCERLSNHRVSCNVCQGEGSINESMNAERPDQAINSTTIPRIVRNGRIYLVVRDKKRDSHRDTGEEVKRLRN